LLIAILETQNLSDLSALLDSGFTFSIHAGYGLVSVHARVSGPATAKNACKVCTLPWNTVPFPLSIARAGRKAFHFTVFGASLSGLQQP
jgi:hypothetical protein